LGILIFKWLTARNFYMSFGVKGLVVVLFIFLLGTVDVLKTAFRKPQISSFFNWENQDPVLWRIIFIQFSFFFLNFLQSGFTMDVMLYCPYRILYKLR
jgi:hypothetical protein